MNVFEYADERLWEIIAEKRKGEENGKVEEEFSALRKAHHTPILLFLYDLLGELNDREIPFAANGHYFPQEIVKRIFQPVDTTAIIMEKPYDGKKLSLYLEVESGRKEEVIELLRNRYENVYRSAYYVEKLRRYIVNLGAYYVSRGATKKPLVEVDGEICLQKDSDKSFLQNKDAEEGFYFVLLPRKNIRFAYKRIPDGRIFDRELGYTILRGADKIGENLIEVTGYGERILLECGRALFPDEGTERTERYVAGERYSAVIVTHAHEDHCGLLDSPIAAEKIYMGEQTFLMLRDRGRICMENEKKVAFMRSEEPFFIGEIRVLPHLCDHSAADSYMIELSDGVKTILYTGDFRNNGRKSFPTLIKRLPDKVDVLICERTMDKPNNHSEWDLENEAVAIMQKHREIFLLQSVLNVDRLVSFYRACIRTGTKYLMTPLQAQTTRHWEKVPNPKGYADCYLYLPRKAEEKTHKYLKDKYGEKLIGREKIAAMDRFAMSVSTGMLDYLVKLAEKRDLSNAVLIYSLWSGYKEKMEAFLSGVEKLGIRVVDLHVSGHADKEAIRAIISKTNPTEIRYVHTEA